MTEGGAVTHDGMGSPIDHNRACAAVRELLLAFGLNPDSDQLRDTPRRVAENYADFFAGLGEDPLALFRDTLPLGEAAGETVIIRDLSLRSLCEHHLLPFRGRAHIAYQPRERVAGLGTLPRLIDMLAARPQLQERLGEQIAETIAHGLEPDGVLVVLEATHACLADRGSRESAASIITIASRGSLSEAGKRAEILALIGAEHP